MWGLFIRVMVMGTTQASNDLTFLVEEKLIKVSTVLDNDRISVVVPVNYSLALVKIQVKNAAKHLKIHIEHPLSIFKMKMIILNHCGA